jgi:hypothetical protein
MIYGGKHPTTVPSFGLYDPTAEGSSSGEDFVDLTYLKKECRPRRIFTGLSATWFNIAIQSRQEDLPVPDQFWLTKAQLWCIELFFPRTRGIPPVDDWRVVAE